MAVPRHRVEHRHRGRRRLFGSWRPGRHCRHARYVDALPPAPAPRALAELVAAPAPGLDVRPVGARPYGPDPYDLHPATMPLAITGAIA